MNTHVLTTVLATVLLMLAVAEAVVVETARLTDSSDFENCTASIKLVPTLRLLPPDHSSSPSSPTLAPLTLPPMTTQSLPYPQPHATPHPTPHATTTTTTPKQLKYKTTPTPHKTLSPFLVSEKHTTLNGKPKATEYSEKPTTTKLFKIQDSFISMKDKFLFWFQDTESSSPSSYSSSVSSSSSTAPPSPKQPHVSTLPPPSLTLPLPTVPYPSVTPTPELKLSEIWEELKHFLTKQIPLVLPSEWAQPFKKSYLERIRAANHEIVDKLLQAEDDEDESTDNHQRGNDTCRLPEKRLAHLFYLRTILVLLLQALPQTVEEVEEAAWNPEITDYIFRPERRAVFDVYGCRECYALDATGVCRELFYCKDGSDLFSRTSRRRPVG